MVVEETLIFPPGAPGAGHSMVYSPPLLLKRSSLIGSSADLVSFDVEASLPLEEAAEIWLPGLQSGLWRFQS